MKAKLLKYMKRSFIMMALSAVFMLLGCVTTQQDTLAGEHVARSLLNGTDLKLYVGTADTATTFTVANLGLDGTDDDVTYATNRTYVNFLGTTVTPLSTNSVTGALVPEPSSEVPVIALQNGAISDNLALSIYFQGSEEFTNTVALTFVRSADGGVTYSTADSGGPEFVVTIDPNGIFGEIHSTLVTNLSSTILQGASHLKLWKVVTAANPTDNGTFTIHNVHLSGWQP